MTNRNRKRRDFVYIPPAVQRGLDAIKRDILLENDRQFAGSFQQLRDGVAAGRVPKERMSSIRNWLIAASLRRNKVSKAESKRMMYA